MSTQQGGKGTDASQRPRLSDAVSSMHVRGEQTCRALAWVASFCLSILSLQHTTAHESGTSIQVHQLHITLGDPLLCTRLPILCVQCPTCSACARATRCSCP
jgi:hypothetical protein